MKRIDKLLCDRHVRRFAAGDNSEQIFSIYDLKYGLPVENSTINWSYFDNIIDMDIMTLGTALNTAVQRPIGLDLNTADNIIQSSFNEKTSERDAHRANGMGRTPNRRTCSNQNAN